MPRPRNSHHQTSIRIKVKDQSIVFYQRDRRQRTTLTKSPNTAQPPSIIMPHLPFNAPSPSTSPQMSPTRSPSIVLSPASGNLIAHIKALPLISPAGGSPVRELHKSKEDMAETYRKRYAQYLAATFNMSLEAAMAEADTQLAPRRNSSDMSEAETLRES